MILWRIAIRNILATKARTAIIALLTILGTALVVVGGSLVSTLEGTMAKSVVGSVSGHLQIYSNEATDKLDMFVPPTGTPDLGEIKDFPKVKKLLETLPTVNAVVPMGTDIAMVFTGNILDIKLEDLRKAILDGNDDEARRLASHVQNICKALDSQTEHLEAFSGSDRVDLAREDAKRKELLERVSSDAYWESFWVEPTMELEFLSNEVAPLAMDEQMLFLRYMGTDTEAFQEEFELFRIVDGEPIPPGQRGFLFSKYMYEQQVKHPVARRLDFIKDKLDSTELVIADDRVLTRMVELNSRQSENIIFQLDVPATKSVTEALQEFLDLDDEALPTLLEAYLDMDDQNFYERYDFFYEHIAPHIILYKVGIGDTLTIRGITQSGYQKAVNVKVYGTYQFEGLEDSALSGVYNIMDIMTYRELYGRQSADRTEEIEKMVDNAGIEVVDRGAAEDELFGGSEDTVIEVAQENFDEFEGIDMEVGGSKYTSALVDRVYTRDEIDNGLVVNAAILLDDRDHLDEARAQIEALNEEHELGLKVVDWQEASGFVGQFIGVIWVVLVTAVSIIFLVALVIINNSMVMATLDRTREIGTLRAIGAQRGYVLKMFLLESSLLGIGSGLLGLLLGIVVVAILGHVGIPAWTTELYFLFAGPSLNPTLAPEHLITGFVLVFVVSMLSTLYPAMLATRVLPIKAMEKED